MPHYSSGRVRLPDLTPACARADNSRGVGIPGSPPVQGRGQAGRRDAAHALRRGLGDSRVLIAGGAPEVEQRAGNPGLYPPKAADGHAARRHAAPDDVGPAGGRHLRRALQDVRVDRQAHGNHLVRRTARSGGHGEGRATGTAVAVSVLHARRRMLLQGQRSGR